MPGEMKAFLCAVLLFFPAFFGCSSVTFTPRQGEAALAPKPGGFEVRVLDRSEAQGFRIIGTVSCQESESSNLWNWWKDHHALIEEMKAENLERLLDEVRDVGGDALIGLSHEIGSGGGSGSSVGVGVGVGSGPVGVGVGTSLFKGNPKVLVVSYGDVGVLK